MPPPLNRRPFTRGYETLVAIAWTMLKKERSVFTRFFGSRDADTAG